MHRPQYVSGEEYLLFILHQSNYKISVIQPGSRNSLSQARRPFTQHAPGRDKARTLNGHRLDYALKVLRTPTEDA